MSRALFALMLAASLALWFGAPAGWLWVGGRIDGLTHSLGAAVLLALLGMIVTVLVALRVLHWIARMHAAAREARGLDDLGFAPLEGVMVLSAVVAIVAFAVWFLGFSGSEPVPLGLPK